MKVAVLGMGQMGRAVAGRLVAGGHQVTVWNRTPGRVAGLVEAGALEAPSARRAVAGVDAALTSLADDAAVLEVVTGPEGIAPVLDGAVLVEASTVAPATTRTVAAAVPGGRMVAAPILGAPAAVEGGTAAYLIAGPSELAGALAPLFDALSPTRLYVGEDPGRASTIKILNNYLLMTGMAAVAELVATAQGLGVDDPALLEFLRVSPVVPPALGNRLDDVVHGDHQGWFSAHLGAKDLALMEGLGAQAGLDLPLCALVRGRYQELDALGTGSQDIAGIVELLRRAT